MPKNVLRRAMQVDGFGDPLEYPLECHLRNGSVAADDIQFYNHERIQFKTGVPPLSLRLAS